MWPQGMRIVVQFSTSNMSPQGDQTHTTCCAQQCCNMLCSNIAIAWPELANVGPTMLQSFGQGLTYATCDFLVSDHVYFVHPSTDISVNISTDTWPMYRLTYRPSVDRYVGRHIDRLSADITTKIHRSTYRPMYQPRFRPSDGRHISRLSADISVDIAVNTRPICWPLIVGGISVDCRWYIGQKLRLWDVGNEYTFSILQCKT